jgi:hypothetical protein
MDFYSYLWLREDGTPLYVGKGTGQRAYVLGSHHLRPPKDKSRILIFPQDSEADAFESEIALIWLFGRKDIGTGILQNRTDGGENPPRAKKGRRLSLLARQHMSLAKIGTRGNHTGFTHSVEARRKMSKPRSHGWTLTEETKQKQCVAARAREARKRERREFERCAQHQSNDDYPGNDGSAPDSHKTPTVF